MQSRKQSSPTIVATTQPDSAYAIYVLFVVTPFPLSQ